MTLLIAVKSCKRDLDLGFHRTIRVTWGNDAQKLGIGLLFFIGSNHVPELYSDEVIVDSPDDYLGLPHKTHQMCKWIKQNTCYQHVFFCDNDTFVKPDKLIQSGYEKYDYAGYYVRGEQEIYSRFDYTDHMGEYKNSYAWASGGVGYFLSSQAVELVADTEPNVWAEDMYVGQTIGPMIESKQFKAGYISPGESSWHIKKSNWRREIRPEHVRRIHQLGDINLFYQETKAIEDEWRRRHP